MKGQKIFSGMLLLAIIMLSVAGIPAPEPFTIKETTHYSLVENTVYLTITENLGKDQNINISNIFVEDDFTKDIVYGEILMMQAYLADAYGTYNETIAKCDKVEEKEVCIGNTSISCVTVDVCIAKDKSEILCDNILPDKSCIKFVYGVIGQETKYDYLPILGLKEKIVIDNLKIEQKHDGIPLPKNSQVQIKYKYRHPVAYGINISESVNKYNIEVESNDGLDKSILDPEWFQTDWKNRMEMNLTCGHNIDVVKKIELDTTGHDKQVDCGDYVFTDLANNTLYYDYEESTCNTPNTIFWLRMNCNTTVQTFYMYYNNSAVANQEDETNTWAGLNAMMITHLDTNPPVDVSGNWPDGVVANEADLTPNGKFGQGFIFDGTGDSVTWLGNVWDDNWTYEFWFNQTAGDIGFSPDKEGGGNYVMRTVLDDDGTNDYHVTVYTACNGGAGEDITFPNGEAGQWQGWTLIYDDTNSNRTVMVNGTFISSGSSPGTPCGDDTNFTLGVSIQYAGTGALHYTGSHDEIRLWDDAKSQIFVEEEWSDPTLAWGAEETAEGGAPADTTLPLVTIELPANATYTATNTSLDYTPYDETALDSCWYSLDNGDTNVTIEGCLNTTFIATEGSNTLNIYVNDSSGNLNATESVSFTIDTIGLEIVITAPQNTTYTTSIGRPVDFYLSEEADTCILEYWSNIDPVRSNYTMPSCANATSVTVDEGLNSVRVWANDSAGNMNVSLTRSYTIDTIPIYSNIVLPQNLSYTTTNRSLNFTVSETPNSCKYELNGANVTISCANTTFTGTEGSNTLKLWTEDINGNTNDSNPVKFTLDTIAPYINIIIPTNTTYTTTNISLNFTVNEPPDICKYELNNVNKTITCANTSFTAIEGSNRVKVYINDTAGILNMSQTVYFTIDTTPPFINITLPANTTYGNLNTSLNFTVSETPDVCKYELNGANTTIICANTTFISIVNTNAIKLWINDSHGNLNVSQSLYFTQVDPDVVVTNPRNITYLTENISLEFTAYDVFNISECRYEFHGSNISLPNCANTTLLAWDGDNTVKVWANNTKNGTQSSSLVAFSFIYQPSLGGGVGGAAFNEDFMLKIMPKFDTICLGKEIEYYIEVYNYLETDRNVTVVVYVSDTDNMIVTEQENNTLEVERMTVGLANGSIETIINWQEGYYKLVAELVGEDLKTSKIVYLEICKKEFFLESWIHDLIYKILLKPINVYIWSVPYGIILLMIAVIVSIIVYVLKPDARWYMNLGWVLFITFMLGLVIWSLASVWYV